MTGRNRSREVVRGGRQKARRLPVGGVVDGEERREMIEKGHQKTEEKEGEGRRIETIPPPQKALTRRGLNTTEGVEENN